MQKKILLAVDGSRHCEGAIREAIKLAGDCAASIRVLHVIPNMATYEGGEQLSKRRCDAERLRLAGDAVLRRALATIRGEKVSAEAVLVDGSSRPIVDEIFAQADAWPADLIVVGTRPSSCTSWQQRPERVIAFVQSDEHSPDELSVQTRELGSPWLVRRVEAFIDAHLDRPFRMEDVVALTRCSPRSIYRVFKQHRGYSPAEYSKRRRLQSAYDLLSNTRPAKSVTDAALTCGFSDLSHFSRDFYDAFGVKPSSLHLHRE